MDREAPSPKRNEMKSFRLYIPQPKVPLADGSETEYAPAEIAEFQEDFKSLGDSWKHHQRLLTGYSLTVMICVVLLFAAPEPLRSNTIVKGVAAALVGACSSWMIWAVLKMPALHCPGCGGCLEHGLEDFCPECGHRDCLESGGWFYAAKCSACRMGLRYHKGRRQFKIRACTHCGLPLDEKGI